MYAAGGVGCCIFENKALVHAPVQCFITADVTKRAGVDRCLDCGFRSKAISRSAFSFKMSFIAQRREKGESRGKAWKKRQGSSILLIRDWFRSFYSKVVVVRFPGVKMAKNPPHSEAQQSCIRTEGDIISTAVPVGIIQYGEGTPHRVLISVLLYTDLKTLDGQFLVLPDEVLQNRASANEFLKEAFQPPTDAVNALSDMR